MRFTDDVVTSLRPNEVFVFGSNDRGEHLAGAAAAAHASFGAEWGVGHGPTGQSYAIDTMSGMDVLKKDVEEFLAYAREHKSNVFLLTPIGCGIAGYTPEQIAPLFRGKPVNVVIPESFVDGIYGHWTEYHSVLRDKEEGASPEHWSHHYGVPDGRYYWHQTLPPHDVDDAVQTRVYSTSQFRSPVDEDVMTASVLLRSLGAERGIDFTLHVEENVNGAAWIALDAVEFGEDAPLVRLSTRMGREAAWDVLRDLTRAN